METSLQVELTSSNNSLDSDLISSLVCIVPTAQCLPTLLVWCLLEKPSHAHTEVGNSEGKAMLTKFWESPFSPCKSNF